MTASRGTHAALLLAALWCVAGVAHAQSSSSVVLGVKGGAGMSSFTGGATGGAEARSATGVGGTMAIRFDPAWSFQIDVLYTTKGADQPGSIQIDNQTYDGPLHWKYAYTDIQAAVVRSLQLGTGAVRLFAGPVLAVLVTAELEHAQGTLDVEQLSTASQMELALGAGYEHPLGPARLGVEARYAFGLNTLDDVQLRETYERKQQSWMILFGAAVDLGH